MSGAPKKGPSMTSARPSPSAHGTEPEINDDQLQRDKLQRRKDHWVATLKYADKKYSELVAFDPKTPKQDITRILDSDKGLAMVSQLPELGGDPGDRTPGKVQVAPLSSDAMKRLERSHQFRTITVEYGNEGDREASLLVPRKSAAPGAVGHPRQSRNPGRTS
ncbi:uncharacterized protein B0H64DRAFT_378005 [Chaetomium fimeti]|uniref:Uncharacterized protein n=1 Tax=Chaetomium fimeti TaxID=1854472 RepID=A0AAE0H776_9PEZI|nr:hypothetical protein B0H64DRAFT_378005 [Chaetomium fimeti]